MFRPGPRAPGWPSGAIQGRPWPSGPGRPSARGIPALDQDTNSLGKRIGWAVTHGIFHDEATLNLLKNERNARGLEPGPIEERRAITKVAPILASLSIDYLLPIEQKIQIFRHRVASVT